MNKKSTLILILIAIVVLLGILDLMLLADMKNISNEMNYNKNNKELNQPNTRIIEVTKHQERLFPNTIYVNKGDRVILSFAASEPVALSINDFGVEETLMLDNVEFVVDKEGAFDFYCLDCDNKVAGLIIVN